MRHRREFRPGIETLTERIVPAHVATGTALIHAAASSFHVATLTLQGFYVIGAAYGPGNSYRYLRFGSLTPTTIPGLGPIVSGGNLSFKGPGTALPAKAPSGSGIGVNNYLFQGANPASPGQFNTVFTSKVTAPTKGFTLAYTFKISFHSGQFTGASGGGTLELLLNPKPSLKATTPAATTYQGQCTIRFHFTPSTVLT